MKLYALILCGLILGFASTATVYAQGGPPPKVKEKIAKSNQGINPFLTQDEILTRLDKEMGVSRDVYNHVSGSLTGAPEPGEVGHDITEKPTTEIMLSLIIATAKVNQGQKTGKYKDADRKKNLISEADAVINRRRAHDGWGGIAEEAGFNSPGDLFSAQRAIEFGQPFSAEMAKKLAYMPPQQQTQVTK